MIRPRPVLMAAVVSLWLGVSWAQDDCLQKCGDSMGSCVSGCSGDTRCASSCAKKLNTCMGRCSTTPGKSPLGKKCVGANGKTIPCPDFKPPPPPREIPPDPVER